MTGANYVIKGKLTTTTVGIDFNSLKIVAYKPLGLSAMQFFGSCSVEASGKFELRFPGYLIGSNPMDVYIMPIPAAIDRSGALHVEMSIPGLYFPRVYIASSEWSLVGGEYTKKIGIDIPAHIWRRWDWLSEEFTVIGRVVKRVGDALLPVPQAYVMAADVDLPLPCSSGAGGAETDNHGNFTINFRRADFFIDFANFDPALGRYGTESWPDLIFHVVQKIAGVKTTIYSEPQDAARPQSSWDVSHRILYVNLVTEMGITNEEIYPPIPAGENFLFHGIGLIQPHSLSDGYATTGPTDDLRNLKDCPFGGTLHIKGQFDTSGPKAPKYYQVLFAKWTAATPPAFSKFQPILNELWTVSKYDTTTGDWRPVVVEPQDGIVTGEKVYVIPDYTDISLTEKNRLISWTTIRQDTGVPRYPEGKYDILIKAWDASRDPVGLNPSHPEHNRLTVVIDNKWPKVLLKGIGTFDILRTDEMLPYTPVCPVFYKSNGHLAVSFDAIDENSHFFYYRLSFITGHNFYVDETKKEYDGKVGSKERFIVKEYHRAVGTPSAVPIAKPDEQKDPGGFPAEVFNWNIGSPDVVRCVYQVRLSAYDRTINGYGHIHYSEDTMHFSIEP